MTLEGGIETGERLKSGEQSQKEKRRAEYEKNNPAKSVAGKAKRAVSKAQISILEVDLGPVVCDLTVRASLSGKVKVAIGPKVHGEYVFVKEADMDYGWFEDAMYALVRELLPNAKPLFPMPVV